MDLKAKLLERTKPEENGCWKFSGSNQPSGYRHLHVGGSRYRRAHRVSYEVHVGPVPQGLCVLHKCDNRWCVNPDHLFIGTFRDNALDMIAKGRRYDNSGERNGRSVLTE